jgi:hypothetical protein
MVDILTVNSDLRNILLLDDFNLLVTKVVHLSSYNSHVAQKCCDDWTVECNHASLAAAAAVVDLDRSSGQKRRWLVRCLRA